MKKVYAAISIMLLVCCNTNKQSNKDVATTVSVLADITDHLRLKPIAKPILSLYHCDKNPDGACVFRLKIISDKKLTPVHTCHLVNAEEMAATNNTNDPQYRSNAILSFYNEVRTTCDSFSRKFDSASALTRSSCYDAICEEIEYLQKKKDTHCYLLVFSDLAEHSNMLNAYTMCATDTTGIIQQFEKHRALPKNLSGITIWFVYEPNTIAEDKRFSIMSALYKTMLVSRGATVIIQADNTNFE